mmetsp:Transcript_7997/g.26274  ORF Transcript_7997/g.26274 Transcript_7997/m.26274 type:complete len:165 (-) Transcript_7997:146-640(-)
MSPCGCCVFCFEGTLFFPDCAFGASYASFLTFFLTLTLTHLGFPGADVAVVLAVSACDFHWADPEAAYVAALVVTFILGSLGVFLLSLAWWHDDRVLSPCDLLPLRRPQRSSSGGLAGRDDVVDDDSANALEQGLLSLSQRNKPSAAPPTDDAPLLPRAGDSLL